MIELVGIESVAHDRVRGFSLGMGQRLGIAAALLGDPDVLVLDEPVNGLDPEGIRWVRELLRDLADEGRTVLVSSHLMSEMEETADHLVVLGRGRLLADLPMADLLGRHSAVRVRSPMASLLARALERAGARVDVLADGALWVEGMDVVEVGDVAFLSDLRVHELTRVTESLEEAYLAPHRGRGRVPGGVRHEGAVPFRALLRSEWTKLRSVRSTWWCTAIYLLLVGGAGWLAAASTDTAAAVRRRGAGWRSPASASVSSSSSCSGCSR